VDDRRDIGPSGVDREMERQLGAGPSVAANDLLRSGLITHQLRSARHSE